MAYKLRFFADFCLALTASQTLIRGSLNTQEDRTPEGVIFEMMDKAQGCDPFTILYHVPENQIPHRYIDSGTEDGVIREAKELAQIVMLNNVLFDSMQT